MQLEDYFEFENFDTKFGPVERIRIKGHRIAIEHVLEHFIQGFSPETITRDVYPSLSLEKVYAAILYYLANQQKLEAYIRAGEAFDAKVEQDIQQKSPSELEKRILAEKSKRQAPRAG